MIRLIRRRIAGLAASMRVCGSVGLVAALSVAPAAAIDGAARYLDEPAAWFQSTAGRTATDHVLSYQTPGGSWPKNIDCTAQLYQGDPAALQGNFDNGATTKELRYLARSYRAAPDERILRAINRGIDQILNAQYPHGGWPQRPLPGKGYARHITFNDGTMVHLLELLRDVDRGEDFAFVDALRKRAAAVAFERGIHCILACQVRVDGRLTVWCAQHDKDDLAPQPARSFELASLSGGESVGIVRLLMSIEQPSAQIVEAVNAAVSWFERSQIRGFRQDYRDDPQAPEGRDKVLVADETAGPLWARFYDIATNRPLFADRDGVPRTRLEDLGYERRNGYSWYTTGPQALLEREYPAWQRRITR